jgi:uncharacterized membrane protein YqjE
MADQATVNGGAQARTGAPFGEGVLSSLAGFGGDVTNLVELQARLAALDLRDATQRATMPAGLVAGGLMLLLGSIPVALLGIAELLVVGFRMQRAWALILTAGVAIAIGVLSALIGLPRLKSSFESLRRSREEFVRNVAWVKTILAQSGRYTPRPRV